MSLARPCIALFVAAVLACGPRTPSPEATAAADEARTRAEAHEQAMAYRLAAAAYREAADLYAKQAEVHGQTPAWAQAVACRNKAGWQWMVYLGAYAEAEQTLQQGRAWAAAHLDDLDPARLTNANYLALAAKYRGDLDTALAGYRALEQAYRTRYGPESIHLAGLLNNLGLTYQDLGETDQALTCFQRALQLKTLHHGPEHPALISTYQNLGHVWFRKGRLAEARTHARHAYDLARERLPRDHPGLAAAAYMLGRIADATGAYEEAAEVLTEAARIQATLYEDTHPHRAHTAWELARARLALGDTAGAKPLLEAATAVFSAAYGTDDYHLAESLNHEAWFYWKTGDETQALEKLARALAALKHRPGAGAPRGRMGDDTLLRCLHGQAVVLATLFRRTGDTVWLDRTLAVLDEAVDLLDLLRAATLSQQAKLDLSRHYHVLLSLGLHTAVVRYGRSGDPAHLQRALAFAERGKLAVLRDALREREAAQWADLPPQVRTRERALKQHIARLERQAADHATDAHDPSHAADLQAAYADLADFLDDLAHSYPAYHQLKYPRTGDAAKALPQGLANDQVLLLYHADDTMLTTFVVDAAHAAVVRRRHTDPADRVPAPDDLPVTDWLDDPYRYAEPGPLAALSRAYAASLRFSPEFAAHQARELSRRLVGPVAAHLGNRRLVVVPDTAFACLPFETLPVDADAAHPVPLIRRHALTYRYAAGLAATEPRPVGPIRAVAAFAPDSGAGAAALPAAAREVAALAAAFGALGITCRTYTGNRARRSLFAREAARVDVLHLAGHGRIDPTGSEAGYLMFAPEAPGDDGRLYPDEVSFMKVAASLVVLSACRTAGGEAVRGEGVMGFCRALFYAGATSVVVSLWPVSDTATARLMTRFYTHLAAGASAEQALHQARLAECAAGSPMAQWAAFVLVTR